MISSKKHYFIHLNLDEHRNSGDSFWNPNLFADFIYGQNLMEKHIHLPLKKEEFTICLKLFWDSVDAPYSSPNGETTKNRSSSIAYIMQKKLLKD